MGYRPRGFLKGVQPKERKLKQRINTYVFVGNQFIPQPLDSEEDEKNRRERKGRGRPQWS